LIGFGQNQNLASPKAFKSPMVMQAPNFQFVIKSFDFVVYCGMEN